MKTLKPFYYHTPSTKDEAITLLKQYGDTARIFAGGTDLLIMLKDRIITVDHLVDIKKIPELRTIEGDETTGLKIGALVRIAELIDSPVIGRHYPSLKQAAEVLASPQIRNKATIGGNIGRSSPSADMPPSLIALDATVTIYGETGERTIPIAEFFTGPGRNVLDCELLTAINIPAVKDTSATIFGKVSRVSEDLAKVNCAVTLQMHGTACDKARVVLGAVAATPIRAKTVEMMLKGKILDTETIKNAAAKASEDIKPISDIRSTAEYRVKVSRILIERLTQQALDECGVN